jgi:hypothetical protein
MRSKSRVIENQHNYNVVKVDNWFIEYGFLLSMEMLYTVMIDVKIKLINDLPSFNSLDRNYLRGGKECIYRLIQEVRQYLIVGE